MRYIPNITYQDRIQIVRRIHVYIMILYDKPVSNHYYNLTLELYPILRTNQIYKRLFFHLSFPKGNFRDEESGYILISESILAMIEEKNLKHKRYKGITLLERFKRDVLSGFEWSSYSAAANKARVVINTGFSPAYQQLLDAEKDRIWTASGRRYFLSGKIYNHTSRIAFRELQRKDAFEMMKLTENPDALFIANYLNKLSSHGFTDIVQNNLEEAIITAKNLEFIPRKKMTEDDRLRMRDAIRQRNLDILSEIEHQSQPFYRSVSGTVRLFTLVAHIGNLNSEIRNVLTRGWVEVDLKSSQLAICATLWNVTDVIEFLYRGGNIWRELFIAYEVEPTDGIKRAFKDALYAILFGAESCDVQRHLTNRLKELGVKQRGDIFINHWIIKEMIDARNKQMQKITEENGAYNIYGDWLSTSDIKCFSVESVLAQQAQAVEMKIISTLFYLAAGNNNFTIQLFQHDGVSIRFHNKNKQQEYIERMKEAVKTMSESLGIPISLEVKQ